jgi:hypothetical protein
VTVSAYASGTQTTTVTTEHFLSSPNVVGTFQLYISTLNMVAGDVIELRVYGLILTGDSPQGILPQRYADAQPVDDLIKVSIPVSNDLTDTNSLRFSLLQTKGTSRAFKWKVLKFA